jgi:glycosyltransferase involved in cell wall biosynthesis
MTDSDAKSAPPQASVIVTTKNSGTTLGTCLASIRQQSYPAVELIVVDNGSTDDTLAIAERYCDQVATKGPERSVQRNYGAELSSGDYLLFIDSDMTLTEGVVAEGVSLLQRPDVNGVVVPEESFGDGFWTKCRILERKCYTGDVTVEAARMYRRADFFAAGGFDINLTGPEDWDLSRRVTGFGKTAGRTTSIIYHNEGRTRLIGSFIKRRYYAPGYLRYLRKHRGAALVQANPVTRLSFLRHWRMLVRHPLLTAGMITLKTFELAAVIEVAVDQMVRKAPELDARSNRDGSSVYGHGS